MKLTVWGKGQASKALAKALNIKRNMITADTIIRYCKLTPHPRATKEINNADAIRRSSNKYTSLKLLEEAGIKVPPCSTRLEDLTKDSFSGIILAREFYHSKGSDIIAIDVKQGNLIYRDNTEEAKRKQYFIKYLKARGEYRYHVAFGKVILPTKKVLAEGETDDSLIRNHQDGKWRQVVCEETPRFSEACIKAVKALGLDFGAVDFLNYKGDPYILEVNTAPGLQVENRLQAYVNAIKEHTGGYHEISDRRPLTRLRRRS